MTKDTLDILIRLWPVYTGTILITAWLVRIEMRVQNHDDAIKEIKPDVKKSITILTKLAKKLRINIID